MAERLSGFVRRFSWPLLAIWLVAMSVAGLSAMSLAGNLSGGGWYVPGSESTAAQQQLTSGFDGRATVDLTLVVRDEQGTSAQPEFAQRVGEVFDEVIADPRLQVVSASGWDTAPDGEREQFVGSDSRTAVTSLGLGLDDGTARRELPAIQDEVAERYSADGLRVAFVGSAPLFGEVNKLSQEGLVRAELIALPLIMVILLLIYRGVVAALVSFVVSGTAIVLTFGTLGVLAKHVELSIFTQNVATMIGLGVGVDYSLFVITRYAEELTAGKDRVAALTATLRTSGETVLFSGLIVMAATSSLFLVDLNVIRSIGLGVVLVVGFSVLASLLVLPVLLYLLGDRVLRLRLPRQTARSSDETGRWAGFARRIMRRPALYLTVTLVAMGALAVPALGLKTFTPDARIVTESSPTRFGYDAINSSFGQGSASPIVVVVTSDEALTDPGVSGSVADVREQLAAIDGVSRIDPPVAALTGGATDGAGYYLSDDARKLVLHVIVNDTASGDLTRQVVEDVRGMTGSTADSDAGLSIVVGGETAEGIDANKAIGDGLVLVLPVMLVVIYLLLLVTFRSILLPLKAIAMNLLSLGATYGVLVLVFQNGAVAELLGMTHLGYVQNLVPIVLLAVLFGLSTDYEVFLINRIREERSNGNSDTESVALGLARTAPLISGAAVLMIAVFGAWTFTSIMPMQQLGFGLALAIALDATIIRLVVVPATMKLMGRWNWWLPGRATAPQSPADLRSGHLETKESQL